MLAANSSKLLNELDAALAEVDAALNELRDAAELESLADLEKRFRDMLAIQQKLTAQTATLEQKRISSSGQLTRTDRDQIRVIGEEERRLEPAQNAEGPQEPGLAGKAQQAVDIFGKWRRDQLGPGRRCLARRLYRDWQATCRRLANRPRDSRATDAAGSQPAKPHHRPAKGSSR